MMVTSSTKQEGKLLALTAFASVVLTTQSFAYTPQQQQMCSGDAMRLCGEYIPDVDRITACMIEKYSSLSDGCKAVFDAPPPPAATVNTAPTPKRASTATTTKPASYTQSTRPNKPLNITPNLKRS